MSTALYNSLTISTASENCRRTFKFFDAWKILREPSTFMTVCNGSTNALLSPHFILQDAELTDSVSTLTSQDGAVFIPGDSTAVGHGEGEIQTSQHTTRSLVGRHKGKKIGKKNNGNTKEDKTSQSCSGATESTKGSSRAA